MPMSQVTHADRTRYASAGGATSVHTTATAAGILDHR